MAFPISLLVNQSTLCIWAGRYVSIRSFKLEMNRSQFSRDFREHPNYQDSWRTQPRPAQSQSKLPKLDSNSAQSPKSTQSCETHLVSLPSRHLPPLTNTPPLNNPLLNSLSKTFLPTTSSNSSSLPPSVLLQSNLSPSGLPLTSLSPKSFPTTKLPPIIMITCDYD